MQSVHEWLKDPKRSYNDGVLIFKAKNPKDAEFFLKVNNPQPGSYHFRMLISKLENVARKELQNPTEKKESAVKQIIKVKDLVQPQQRVKSVAAGKNSTAEKSNSLRIVDNPTVDYKLLPEDLQKKFNRNKEIVKLLSQLQVKLKAAKSDDERKVLVNELQVLETQKKSNWKAIDDWWAGNKPVAKKLTPEEEIAQKALAKSRRIETLKIYISREKKSLEKAAEEKKAKIQEKISKFEEELSELQK